MPRCAAKGRMMQSSGNVSLTAPDGTHSIQKPWIFRVEEGHWHQCEYVNGKLIMDTSVEFDYPEIDVVMNWSPSGSSPRIYFPNSVQIGLEAVEGLRRIFGFAANEVGVYTSLTPAQSTSNPDWLTWQNLIGDKRPDGSEITEVIVEGQGTKGGWVLAIPDGSVRGTQVEGEPIDLPTVRFAIVGAKDGTLFTGNRTLYFQSGVDSTTRAAVRTQFGFQAGAGDAASIEVLIVDAHPLIHITPKD